MRPWFLRGKVIHGFGRGGTQLGYPTANVELSKDAIEFLRPFNDQVLWGWGCVEADRSHMDAEDASKDAGPPSSLGPFPFAMSIGNNPQFENAEISAEVYFLHKFEADFYGYVVRIITLESIRPQAAFTTLEGLIKTIDGDCSFTQEHKLMPQWAPYGQHKMVQPSATLAELNLSEDLPAFGFLDA